MTSNWLRVAVVAVLVWVVGLVEPSPAVAVVDACPADLSSSGFVDLDGVSTNAVAAIDCIAHYGITTGTGFLTYSPNAAVPRWQMAIFLERTARSLDMALPALSSYGFTDLGGLDPTAWSAINRIAAMGITTGTTPTTFSPQETLPRWQMAVFLTRLLARAGVAMPSGSDQGFTDLAGLSSAATKAINQAAQLGVTSGTSATTFSPNTSMPRWQMAVFLANALRIAGADPYGVKLSLSSASAPTDGVVIATATVTGPDGKPLVGQLVDVFVASSLGSDGRCVIDTDASIDGGDGGSSANCQIDWADPRSDSEGKVTVLITHAPVEETDRIFAWVGPTGRIFDSDTATDVASASVTWLAVPAVLQISSPQNLNFGDVAAVTARLSASTGSPSPGKAIRFIVERNGAPFFEQTVVTNANGNAAIVYMGPADPSPGDDPPTVDTVRAFWDRDGDGIDGGAAELDATTSVTWDD